MFFSMTPVTPIMIGSTSTFLFHIIWHSYLETCIPACLLFGLLLDIVPNLNHKEGMAPKEGAWAPQMKVTTPTMPPEGAPKVYSNAHRLPS